MRNYRIKVLVVPSLLEQAITGRPIVETTVQVRAKSYEEAARLAEELASGGCAQGREDE